MIIHEFENVLPYVLEYDEIDKVKSDHEFVAMCSKCFLSHDKCECNKAKAEYITIDKLIFPAISLLNQKGYTTRFCCSGHPYNNYITEAYIYFDKDIKSYGPRMIRSQFVTQMFDRITVRFSLHDYIKIKNKKVYIKLDEKTRLLEEINKNIYDWVVTLPEKKRKRK